VRFFRRILRRVRPARLWVVHHPDYGHALPHVPLDPRRADRIVTFLRAEHAVHPEAVTHPHPASLEAILRVHTPEYLAALDRVEVISQAMGVPLTDADGQAVLGWQRLAAGGTIRAARLALRTRRPALNLAGGLHHATPGQGMGFCLINDIAIAIAHLRHYGFDGPVLVVDLDLHDGNGTRAAFASDPSVHTFSIHNADWEPRGGVASTALALGSGVDDASYHAVLRQSLPPVIQAHRPAFVIYVAGTDPAEDDRLGDWRLTAGGILDRDRFVIEQVRRLGGDVPIVVVLAGGYGRESWRYTARFAAWLAQGTVVEPPDDLELLLRQARRTELPRDRADDWGLTDADLVGVAPGATPRVLGSFSPHALELSLERTGLLAAVRERGFRNPGVTVDTGSGLGDTIRLFGDAERRELLMELRISRSKRAVPGMEMLYVEWLKLQNPRAGFTATASRLPGQEHPGLGLLREVVAWLVRVCETLGLDGLAARPAQYYMAALSRHHMSFLEPAAQARCDALHDVLASLPLPQAEELLAASRVTDAATGQPVRWEPVLQVYPVSERLKRLVEDRRAQPAPRPRFVLAPAQAN
jgi:acetoin utilization deacetylase AcuC-like enzyme